MTYNPELVPVAASAIRAAITQRLGVHSKRLTEVADEMTWRGIGRTVLEALADADVPEKTPSRDHDPVHAPSHYTSSPAKCSGCGKTIECIDVTRHHGFNIGNVIKYLWREGLKGAALGLKSSSIEDLEKAAWYLQDEIAKRKGVTS
jgi:uncharacterized protein DUF3310